MSAEPERKIRQTLALDSGEHLGVDRLDTANEQSVLDRGNRSGTLLHHDAPLQTDRGTLLHDPPLQLDKTAIPQRRTHLIQGLDGADGRVARQPEHHTCATNSRSPSTNSISPTTAHPIRAGSAIRASVPHLVLRTSFSALGLLFLNSSET